MFSTNFHLHLARISFAEKTWLSANSCSLLIRQTHRVLTRGVANFSSVVCKNLLFGPIFLPFKLISKRCFPFYYKTCFRFSPIRFSYFSTYHLHPLAGFEPEQGLLFAFCFSLDDKTLKRHLDIFDNSFSRELAQFAYKDQ